MMAAGAVVGIKYYSEEKGCDLPAAAYQLCLHLGMKTC